MNHNGGSLLDEEFWEYKDQDGIGSGNYPGGAKMNNTRIWMDYLKKEYEDEESDLQQYSFFHPYIEDLKVLDNRKYDY